MSPESAQGALPSGTSCELADAPPRDLTGKAPLLFGAGFAIAFIGSMCGIGGGFCGCRFGFLLRG